jgi:phage terminase large subunit-like protein
MRPASGFATSCEPRSGRGTRSRETNFIRDIFVLAPKGSSKTSYGAGMALSVMLMNKRPRAEALFIGPTQAISDRAYEQAVGMIEESPDLKRRFRTRDHIKTIEDLVNSPR